MPILPALRITREKIVAFVEEIGDEAARNIVRAQTTEQLDDMNANELRQALWDAYNTTSTGWADLDREALIRELLDVAEAIGDIEESTWEEFESDLRSYLPDTRTLP